MWDHCDGIEIERNLSLIKIFYFLILFIELMKNAFVAGIGMTLKLQETLFCNIIIASGDSMTSHITTRFTTSLHTLVLFRISITLRILIEPVSLTFFLSSIFSTILFLRRIFPPARQA